MKILKRKKKQPKVTKFWPRVGNFGWRKFFPTKFFADKVTNRDLTFKFKIFIGCQNSIISDDATLRYY